MKPTKNRVFCNECRRPKMLFETEKKALLFMKFNNEEIASENDIVPTRAYFCEACGGWHLTHFSAPQQNKSKTQRVIEYMHTQQAIRKAQAEARKQLLDEQNKIRQETHTEVINQLSEIDKQIKKGNTAEALALVKKLLELSKTKYITPKVKKRIKKRYLLLTSKYAS